MNDDPQDVEDSQLIHYPESNLSSLGKAEWQYLRERLADLLATILQQNK